MNAVEKALYDWLRLFVADHTKVIKNYNVGLCNNLYVYYKGISCKNQSGHTVFLCNATQRIFINLISPKCEHGFFPDMHTYDMHKFYCTLYTGEQLKLRKELANYVMLKLETKEG